MQRGQANQLPWKTRREIERVILANRCMTISRMNVTALLMLSLLILSMLVVLTFTSTPLQDMILQAWTPVMSLLLPEAPVEIYSTGYDFCEIVATAITVC